MSQVAARAGVDRRDQHKLSWEPDPLRCTADYYHAILERLTQCLQNIAGEFRHFVQEQYPQMGQTYLSRDRVAPATD